MDDIRGFDSTDRRLKQVIGYVCITLILSTPHIPCIRQNRAMAAAEVSEADLAECRELQEQEVRGACVFCGLSIDQTQLLPTASCAPSHPAKCCDLYISQTQPPTDLSRPPPPTPPHPTTQRP